MRYEAPSLEMLTMPDDAIMISLDDLYAINLWDMLLEEAE